MRGQAENAPETLLNKLGRDRGRAGRTVRLPDAAIDGALHRAAGAVTAWPEGEFEVQSSKFKVGTPTDRGRLVR